MILLIGDVHGNFRELTYQLSERKIHDMNLIQVGDFGVGFKKLQHEQNELQILNSFLQAHNNVLFVIRGNHDDPAYFTGRSAFSNIYYIEDYSIVEIGGKNILCIGGAISVDRLARTIGVNYWPNEKFVLDEGKLAKALASINQLDIVVTHTAPKEFWPIELDYIVKYFATRDHSLLEELESERSDISALLKLILNHGFSPTDWYYGHFHTSVSGHALGLQYHALGIMEFTEPVDS